MKPVNHPSNTRTLGAPVGWDQSGLPVEPLGITDTELQGVPCVMSFWQPDDVDLANIAAGGLIGLSIVGRPMPPACVVTLYPEGHASTPHDFASQADAAARDAQRLDYLQVRGATVEILPEGPGWKFRIGGLHKAVSHDVRSAIDAAIAAQASGAQRDEQP